MKFNLSKIEISYFDKNTELTLPEFPSCELAEFIGILTGDGYMNKYGKYFSFLEIAGDSKLDYDYLTGHVSGIIFELFNILPKVQFKKYQNCMYLRLMSKGLNNYLKEIGFKNGKKTLIEIPKWILNDNDFMKSFIQGLADTDGCIALLNRKQKKFLFYPRIQIALNNKYIIHTTGNWLKNKGIRASLQMDNKKLTYKGETKNHVGYRFQISGRKQVEKWMDIIGFRNKRHLDKYKKYKNGTAGI